MNDIVLSDDQSWVIRAMMDEYKSTEDPDKLHRLFLLLEYILSARR